MTGAGDRVKEIAREVREKFLAERAAGIGGSDAAAALGLSPYKTPLRLWAEKVGLAEPDEISDRYERRGRLCEPVVAHLYAEQTGRIVRYPGPFLVHPSQPWRRSHVDAEVYHVPNSDAMLVGEFKTTNLWAARGTWDAGEVPLHYSIQGQHGAECAPGRYSGVAYGALIAPDPVLDLIANVAEAYGVQAAVEVTRPLLSDTEGEVRLHVVDVGLVPSFARVLEERLAEFWSYVERKVPPYDLARAGDADTVAAMFPAPEAGTVVDLGDRGAILDAIVVDAQARIAEEEGRLEDAKAQLACLLGDAEIGVLPSGLRWTFKTQTRAGYTKTVEPWEGRVLRGPVKKSREKIAR